MMVPEVNDGDKGEEEDETSKRKQGAPVVIVPIKKKTKPGTCNRNLYLLLSCSTGLVS